MMFETNEVIDYLYYRTKGRSLEGDEKTLERITQRGLDEKWPGKYLVEVTYDNRTSFLTYNLTSKDQNKLFYTTSRKVDYRTPEEQVWFDQMIDNMDF